MKFLFGALFGLYVLLFYESVSGVWFNPLYTSTSGSSTLFTFYQFLYPQVFGADEITAAVSSSLPLIHLYLGAGLTWFTEDPVMTGHWLTLVQTVLPLLLLGFGLRSVISPPPLFFSLLWFLHTRPFMERMAGGDPRGWAPTVIALILFTVVEKKGKWIELVLFCSFFLHREAALVGTVSVALLYLFRFRREGHKPFQRSGIFRVVPVLIGAGVAFSPGNSLGSAVRLARVADEVALTRLGSHFGVLPFRSFDRELAPNLAPIWGGESNPDLVYGVILLWSALFILALRTKRGGVRPELLAVGAASIVCYFCARHFALLLSLPEEYLFYPLAVAQIFLLPSLLWSQVSRGGMRDFSAAVVLVCSLAAILVRGGSGLHGNAGLDSRIDRDLDLFQFIGSETPADSVIAGHPERLNGVQLLGLRQGYITADTALPYFHNYLELGKKRAEISLRALYAANREEFLAAAREGGFNYFVFYHDDFEPNALEHPDLEIRYLATAKELLRRSGGEFGASILAGEDPQGVVFRSDDAVLVKVD